MSCLKKWHGLYSGQLKDTMGGRLVMSCLSDIFLGPSFVQFTPAGAGGQVHVWSGLEHVIPRRVCACTPSREQRGLNSRPTLTRPIVRLDPDSCIPPPPPKRDPLPTPIDIFWIQHPNTHTL